jgi:hypothetical protein
MFTNNLTVNMIFAAYGSTLISKTDFDVMTRASFLDRVIMMQLESKYRRNLDFGQSVIALALYFPP